MSESTPSKMVEKAREAAKKKNFDYAVTLYLEHLKVTPGDVEARKELRATARERFKLSPPGMLSRAKIATQVRTAAAWPVSKKDPEKTVIQCEDVLALDPKNPQVAARLATAFRSWRPLESDRRAKAQAALERIKAAPSLSRDLADIVQRALG